MRLACAPLERLPGRKATFEAIPNADEFDAALAVLREAVDIATNALGSVAERHPDLVAATRSGAEIAVRLKRWATPGRDGAGFNDEGWGRDDQAPAPAPAPQSELGDGLSTPAAILEGAAAAVEWTGPAVRWVEHGQHHVRLHSAPLSVAQAFSKYRKPGQALSLIHI